MKKNDGGLLLAFTFVKDDFFPFSYAYGVRLSEKYGAHFIRTTPVERVDYNEQRIYTMLNSYHFLLLIDDESYRKLLFERFAHIVMPLWEEELILSPAGIMLH